MASLRIGTAYKDYPVLIGLLEEQNLTIWNGNKFQDSYIGSQIEIFSEHQSNAEKGGWII